MDDQKRHKRINLTDPEARLMKGRQGIVAGYNAQAMVSPIETDGEATGMLVTAVDVVDQANDNVYTEFVAFRVDHGNFATRTRATVRTSSKHCNVMDHLVNVGYNRRSADDIESSNHFSIRILHWR